MSKSCLEALSTLMITTRETLFFMLLISLNLRNGKLERFETDKSCVSSAPLFIRDH